ncbi:MAG: MarR family winged helix-turn-helix transcriptional regulator [Jatrophihabitantaceae bacterium]
MTTSVAPEDDALAQWEAISRRVQSTQQRLVTRIEKSGVPSQWFAVLHLLLHADQRRMPMTRLADELSMTSGGFTKLADRMGQEGLIDRRNSSGDRRVVYAGLTGEGLRLARQTERMYRDAVQEHVLEVLTSEKLTLLAAESEPLDRSAGEDGADDASDALSRDPALPDRRTR